MSYVWVCLVKHISTGAYFHAEVSCPVVVGKVGASHAAVHMETLKRTLICSWEDTKRAHHEIVQPPALQ